MGVLPAGVGRGPAQHRAGSGHGRGEEGNEAGPGLHSWLGLCWTGAAPHR